MLKKFIFTLALCASAAAAEAQSFKPTIIEQVRAVRMSEEDIPGGDQWWRGGRRKAKPTHIEGSSGGGTCDAADIAVGASGCPLLTEAMAIGQIDGGFCGPDTSSNGQWPESAPGWTVGYSPERNSFFWDGGSGASSSASSIFETNIPAIVYSSSASALNKASYTATGGLVEPTEGIFTQSWPDSPSTDGILTRPTMLLPWSNGKLYGGIAYYYESGSPNTRPFYSRPLDLNDTGHVAGMYMPWTTTGDASGYYINRMISVCGGRIPSEWQPSFGSKPAFLCSGATYSVISNQSYGTAMFVVDPTNITGNNVATTKAIVFYPNDHAEVGGWDGYVAGEFMDISTQITGCVMINGTRTALCFGSMGTTDCYGYGLSDPADSRIGTQVVPGDPANYWCYDPTNSDHGNHGYPYAYRVWALDMKDLAAVYAGTKTAWTVRPYGLWTLNFPITPDPALMPRIRGVGYDSTNHYLYVFQDRVCSGPIAAAWRISVDITP